MYKQVGGTYTTDSGTVLRTFYHLPFREKMGQDSDGAYYIADVGVRDDMLVVSEGNFDPDRKDLKNKKGF